MTFLFVGCGTENGKEISQTEPTLEVEFVSSFKVATSLHDMICNPSKIDRLYEKCVESIDQFTNNEERKAVVTTKLSFDTTLLHTAASKGLYSICEWLIKNGADVSVINEWGYTPLHDAARTGHIAICELLMNQKVRSYSLDVESPQFTTPLHEAAIFGHSAICQLLIDGHDSWFDKGMNLPFVSDKVALLNSKTADLGLTPLHCAARSGNIEICKILIENGADVNAIDNEENTPLHVAAEKGYIELYLFLVESNAEF